MLYIAFELYITAATTSHPNIYMYIVKTGLRGPRPRRM